MRSTLEPVTHTHRQTYSDESKCLVRYSLYTGTILDAYVQGLTRLKALRVSGSVLCYKVDRQHELSQAPNVNHLILFKPVLIYHFYIFIYVTMIIIYMIIYI